MNHGDNLGICKVCMCQNVHLKESSKQPIRSKEVNVTCASVQGESCYDTSELICSKCLKVNASNIKTECDEIFIEETKIDDVYIKKEPEETPSQPFPVNFIELNSFCEGVKTESDSLDDPLHVDRNDEPNLTKGDKEHKCILCSKNLSTAYTLKKHQRTHTREKPFKCDTCDKQFSQSSNLRRHIQIHLGQRPHTCDVCCKNFYDSGDLKRHKRLHTGERPFKCDMCDMKFTQTSSLKMHKQTHEQSQGKGKRYKCDACCRDFTRLSDLIRHQITHTGEKPFQCEICAKQFNKACNLKRHLQTHTGEKPFKCDVCCKNFAASGDLKKHKRRHTQQYKCNICCKAFSCLSHLTRHQLKKDHRDTKGNNSNVT